MKKLTRQKINEVSIQVFQAGFAILALGVLVPIVVAIIWIVK